MSSKFRGIKTRLQWIFMSQEARYAYLWNRTKRSQQVVYPSTFMT